MLYLIPCNIAPDADHVIPPYVLDCIESCQILFVEEARTTRRFLKRLKKELAIDAFDWYDLTKDEDILYSTLRAGMLSKKNMGIISEAGCPGIADPGQALVAFAQANGCIVKPLVGPNSILLALMASGMNGQSFEFCGYLPVDSESRNKKIRELENLSRKHQSTKIFIETPYRNEALFDALLTQCESSTRLCIASDLTGAFESIKTRTIQQWKNHKPTLHKLPTIFLIQA